MTLTRDQKIAFAEFLLSEKKRHEEDIEMIDKKLLLLAKSGIIPRGVAPWVEDTDLITPKILDGPFEFIPHNESPLGGYWRYRLDKAFDNTTSQEIDINDSGAP
jgi:hypothetical protein